MHLLFTGSQHLFSACCIAPTTTLPALRKEEDHGNRSLAGFYTQLIRIYKRYYISYVYIAIGESGTLSG